MSGRSCLPDLSVRGNESTDEDQSKEFEVHFLNLGSLFNGRCDRAAAYSSCIYSSKNNQLMPVQIAAPLYSLFCENDGNRKCEGIFSRFCAGDARDVDFYLASLSELRHSQN